MGVPQRRLGRFEIWKLVPNGANSFQVGTVAGQRAEWSNFGDCEALALGTFAEPSTLFTVEEASNSIQEWNLSSPTAIRRRTWNLTAHVPTYDYPGSANDEGFAIQWSPGSCVGQRGGFVITDDGGGNSVRWCRQFPCGF